ncbi:MAG: c-type cytochrome [Gemmatimonadota bacterium]|nr:c-type cytochrome [Gemmatimonadota bacterium]
MSGMRVVLFVLVLVGLFMWAGEVLNRASGSTRRAVSTEGVTLENGEIVFWGAGKCHTCHAIGPRGTSVRGPNLGESADGQDMAVRAIERAEARADELGRGMSPTEYLVESLTDPGVHVVSGYKNEMPVIYEPPISLEPDQLASVVLYLQSIGGQPDPAGIELPAAALAAGRGDDEQAAWEPYLDGDPALGRAMFFDEAGAAACSRCHVVAEEGGRVGPELTEIAGTRTARFIVESLLEPSASIAGGYETVLIETTVGVILDGVLVRETPDSLWLADATGEETILARRDVARSREQETSLMPENLADLLSVRDLHDLLAYLRTLR